jgi:hypothetical protein
MITRGLPSKREEIGGFSCADEAAAVPVEPIKDNDETRLVVVGIDHVAARTRRILATEVPRSNLAARSQRRGSPRRKLRAAARRQVRTPTPPY